MADESVLVSFIVPAHNVESYLTSCIESIVKDADDSLLDYEVIIVENGSDDHTYDIAKQLCQVHSKVNLLKSDEGVSVARNLGIHNATGQKLIFVDADDLWVYGSIKKIFWQFRQQNVDLMVCSYYKSGRKTSMDFQYEEQPITGDDLITCRAWMLSRPNLRMTVWAKVFDKNVIEQNQIFFNENLDFSEDSEFLFRYTKSCKSIWITTLAVYEYCVHNDSVMHSANKDRICGYLRSLQLTREMIQNEPTEIRKAFWEYVLIHFNLICVHDVFDIESKESFFKRLKIMSDLRKKDIFAEALYRISMRSCMTMQLIPEFFIKCHIPVVGGLICYVKSFLNHMRGTVD